MIWTDGERRRWRERIEWLRDEFPADLPVRVHRVQYRKQFGSAQQEDGFFLIRVARRLDYSTAVHTLHHEWAHCLEWRDYHDHGPAWAQAYGEIYRAAERREVEEG